MGRFDRANAGMLGSLLSVSGIWRKRSALLLLIAGISCSEAFVPSLHQAGSSSSGILRLRRNINPLATAGRVLPQALAKQRRASLIAQQAIAKPVAGDGVTVAPSTENLLALLRTIGLDAAQADELVQCGKFATASPGDELLEDGRSVAVERSLFLLLDGA
jgi:hypothetical protein